MPDFNEFVRNLYTSKNRELTEDKLKYIEETYKGKEEDFVKNFYSTIGEELSEEKFNYIKDTYLKKKEQQVLYGNQPFGGKEEEPLLPLTSSTVSPSASKPPKSTTPSASTGKLPATTAPTSKAAKDEYIPVKAEMLIDGYSPEMERNRQKNYTQGYQRAYKKGQEYATRLEQTAVKVNQMDAQLEQLKGNPEQYNALVEQRNALAEQMRVVNDSLKGEIAKMDIYQKGLSVTDLKREINEDTAFNRMTVGVNEFQKMVLNTIPMMDRAATYLSGKVIGMDDKELSDAIQLNQDLKWGKIKEISKRLTEENEALVENFTSKTAWGEMTNGSDVATVSDLAAKELLQTIPVTLGLVATYINPYVGGAVTIFGTAGNKIDEMDVENPNMSEGAKITNALATGGLEYVTERVFGSIPIIGRAIGSKSEVGKKIFQNVVVETWTKYAKKMGFPADVIEEVSTEMLNTLGENYTDYMTGKTSELDLTKGLGQTFTTALSMAATLSGGGRAIKYGSKKINELTAETKKLKEAAANPDLKPDVVTTIEEKVIQNNEEIANEAEAEKKIFDAMPNKDYEEATALIQENQSLQEQLDNNEIPEEIIPVIERKIVDNNAIIEDIKQRQNKDAIQESSTVENEISSGDTSARTDVGGAEDGGTSSIIDKREPNKEPVIQEGEAKEEVVSEPTLESEEDIKNRTENDFANENEYYRVIVGDEAFNDIVESGVVRTNAKNKGGQSLAEKLANRPTLYPSFSRGSASMHYANSNPNHYIIVTDDASIQPSKSGRHGMGTTMFPTDENGNHLESLDGKKVKVYRHIGNGKYELVYANGKLINQQTTKQVADVKLGKEQPKPTEKAEEAPVKEEEVSEAEVKSVAEVSGVNPKNIRDLYNIGRDLFALNRVQALAQAVVMDKMIGAMAKRKGVEKSEIYKTVQFKKSSEKDLPQGVKMQMAAWHGSPYEFDKFTTEKIGTGEGAQAFGWGLYFTDLKDIAKLYAKKLAKIKFENKELEENSIFDKLFVSLDESNEEFYSWFTGRIFNLAKFKEYLDDISSYYQEQLKIKVDEKHPLVIKMMRDYEYSQDKIEQAKKTLRDFDKNKYNSVYDMFIKAGVSEENAKNGTDIIFKGVEQSRRFLYEAMQYQSSRASKLDKVINFVKNELKSNANYYSYLSKNSDKFNLSRSLYKVSLFKGKEQSEYTWLEWDKPVSEENFYKIKEALIAKGYTIKGDSKYGFDLYSKNGLSLGHYNIAEVGKYFYKNISYVLGGDKAASLFLLENGIDGIKYAAESISRGATSKTARGFNYVVFDENAVSIEESIKFQKDAVKARGAMMVNMDGQAVIYALSDPNVSTPLHELAHVFEHYLTDNEKNEIVESAGTKGWTIETSEFFARGFEKYLSDGKAPSKGLQRLFDKFKEWLTEIYNGIINSDIDIELNEKMENIYSQMLGVDIKKKKQGFPKNVLAIAEETGLSPQQIQNTYAKYDGSKSMEEITVEDYKTARAIGDKAKLENVTKAFDALLQEESAKTAASPTAKKKAEKALKEADEKAVKEAAKIMEHIDEIRGKLQESGVIVSTSCKWGK